MHDRLPCPDIRVIRSIDGKTWFGSAKGAFMLRTDGKFDYYASKRWIPSDRVNDIAAGSNGTVLILTDKGLGTIHFQPMTLYQKALFYEKQVRARHIRLGFNATLARMKDGDPTTGSLEDSDNDGLWTAMYLGAEVFRYAVTRSPQALQNCRESLDAMQRLYTINPLKGFPSRSFERRGYESSDTQVWRKAENPEWDWKSTTSSDEAIGHMFVFSAIAELVDDTAMQHKAIRLMDALMQHIVDHNMSLIDWDGKPTTWGKWYPDYVNARPEMVGDRKINSSNIIAMLQTAWHFTGKPIYRDKAFELMNKHGYLKNLMRPMKDVGPAPSDADALSRDLSESWNHSDDEMYFLGYWGLYRYAFNDTLKTRFKAAILDHWEAERPEKEGAWDIFTAITGTPHFDLAEAVEYLQRYPLDLIHWRVENSERKDIVFIPANFRGQTIQKVLPPDELPINRHNANRFDLDGGDDGHSEYSAGDIWLLPYWMGRYLKIISAPPATSAAPQLSQVFNIAPHISLSAGTPTVAGISTSGLASASSRPVISVLPNRHSDSSAYQDSLFEQAFGIRYYVEDKDVKLLQIASDRNGHIQILSNTGLLQPRAGRLLYPGRLVKDLRYRPLTDMKITALGLYQGQFVYVNDKALLSNAWAGRLYALHHMPRASLLAGGKGFTFMVSDGLHMALFQNSKLLWKGKSNDSLLQIQYQPEQDRFYLLTTRSLLSFSPKEERVQTLFSGQAFTCFCLMPDKMLLGSHDGYLELAMPSCKPIGGYHRNLPDTDLTAIAAIRGHTWFGSSNGAFMALPDGKFRYYNSERWIPGKRVIGLAEGENNTVLILTDQGLGKICFDKMNLEQKAMYYENIIRQRHIRYGFYSDYSNTRKGDLSTVQMGWHDSENLWTSMYLVGELFRYLVTHDPEAKQNCLESFDAMERLFTLSGVPGLFGRCIERSGVVAFKREDRNNIEDYWYPGYAHTPSSWRHSADSEWDWRGSASSDQAVGQFFTLTLVAEYADDSDLKTRAIHLIDQLTGYILDNGLKLIDFNGKPTLWGIWAPEYVNRFPDMVGDRKLYSSNIISFLQIAYRFTHKEKYKNAAMDLLYKEHYLDNLMRPVRQIGPAPEKADRWSRMLSGGWNYSDDEMYFLAYWGLYSYALSDTLKQQYRTAIQDHWEYIRPEKDALWDFSYGALTKAGNYDRDGAVWELKRMPLDLITWPVDNSSRKDLDFMPENNRKQVTREVLPPDERPENKHNRNLYQLDERGDGSAELGGGDIYLLPYWMGRYFGMISPPAGNKNWE